MSSMIASVLKLTKLHAKTFQHRAREKLGRNGSSNIYEGGNHIMNLSEENRNNRRDKKRHTGKYGPVRFNGVKGYSKYAWFQRKQDKKEGSS